jgi:non-specific serine/threonine protein kinase
VDGLSRYAMLETVRAYALDRLEETGEREQAERAMAAWMLKEAERAASNFSGPADGLAGWWGDAEQDNVRAAMEWLLGRDGRGALRLAIARCPWAFLRGHYREGRVALEKALAVSSADGSDLLPTVELWLGRLAHYSSHLGVGLDHFRRAEALLRPQPESGDLVDALVGQTWELCDLDQIALAQAKAEDALAMARAIGYDSGESHALGALSMAALYAGEYAPALAWARQASGVDRDRSSGHATRYALTMEALAWASTGDLDSAERLLRENLGLCRQAGDRSWEAMQLESLARIEIKTQRREHAAEHLNDATRISAEVGEAVKLADCLATAAVWAAKQNPQNAAVLWGAGRAVAETILPYLVPLAEMVDRADVTSAEDAAFFTQPMLDVRDRLGAGLARQSDDRGAAMGLDAVLGLVRQVLAETPSLSTGTGGAASNLTRRERELIALVAEGLTDAEIAQKLFISIRTVRSHLDRIKDKTGARRRAELTRLAVREGLAYAS